MQEFIILTLYKSAVICYLHLKGSPKEVCEDMKANLGRVFLSQGMVKNRMLNSNVTEIDGCMNAGFSFLLDFDCYKNKCGPAH